MIADTDSKIYSKWRKLY